MTVQDVTSIVADVKYRPGTWWRVGPMGDGFYLQPRLLADGVEWPCRKWYVSRHSTVSEIVQTCFKAIMTAEEHEIREKFTYRGQAIFGPHFDVDNLVHQMRNHRLPLDAREDNALQEQSPATSLSCEDGGRRTLALGGEGVRRRFQGHEAS